LDTLNELAAALGDDPNFATTTATAIGLKAPIASPAFNSGTGNVVASFTSTDTIAAIQLVDNNGNVEIGAVGNDFHVMNAGGAAKLVVLNSGNVGIGVTNPGQTLEIHNSDASDYTDFALRGTGHKYVIGVGNDSVATVNDKWYLYDNDNTAFRMVVDTSGNVGIGTSTPAASLHIAATNNNNNGIMKLGARTWFSHTDEGQTHTFLANDYNDNAAQFGIRMKGVAESDEKFTILGSGNVGIGTSSPAAKLHLNSSSTTAIVFDSDTSTQNYELGIGYGGVGTSSFYLYDNTANAARLVIDSSGNLLVGNTVVNPASGFSTQRGFGYAGATGKVEIATTANDSVMEIGKNNATDGSLLVFRKQGTVVGSIGTAFGELTIGNGGSGLMFVDAGPDRVLPTTSTGAAADGLIDLGDNDDRFKDLYLSGGVRNVNGDGFNAGTENGEPILIPADTSGPLNNQGSLGHPSYRWKDAYLSGTIALTTADNASAANMFVSPSTDFLYLEHPANGMIFRNTSGAERIRISSSGKVGIGNVAPLARMTIGSSQGNSLEFSYDTSNGYRNNISNYWNSGADTRMDFNIGRVANVAPVTVMSVGYNNNVGIGTASPGAKLEIKDGDLWLNAASSGDPEIFFVDDSGVGTAGAKIRYGNSDGNVYFDHKWDNAGSGFFFRNRVDGTALNTMALVNGIVTMPYQPAFSAYANTNETTAAGATAPFTATIFDQGGNYSTANRRFVAPVAGIYQFSTYTNANGVSAGGSMWCAFAVNGAYRGAYMYLVVPTGATWVLIGGTQTIKLAANDYVEVKAGVAMHWDYGSAAWSNFSGHLVG
jgi:hypothetical protein